MLVTSKHSTLSSLPDRLKDPLQKINCGLSGATEDASVTELAETSSGHVFLCLSSSQVSAEIKIYARYLPYYSVHIVPGDPKTAQCRPHIVS